MADVAKRQLRNLLRAIIGDSASTKTVSWRYSIKSGEIRTLPADKRNP
jgi:hypothetical protein